MLQFRPTPREAFSLLFLVAQLLTLTRAIETDFLFHMTMDDGHKQLWVDAHNYYRRNVSDPDAANMRLMTWDDELAALAERVVETCSFAHTSVGDLKTSVFNPAGENIYAGGNYRFSEIMTLDGVTKAWFDENQWYDDITLACDPGQVCGHYTQTVWAKSYKVGCAIGRCSAIEGGFSNTLVSCNYGPAGNEYLYDTPVAPFIRGEPCTACGDGDMCIDQLCNNTARDIPFTTTTEPITSVAITTVPTTTPEETTETASTPSPITSAATTSPETTMEATTEKSTTTTSPLSSAVTISAVTNSSVTKTTVAKTAATNSETPYEKSTTTTSPLTSAVTISVVTKSTATKLAVTKTTVAKTAVTESGTPNENSTTADTTVSSTLTTSSGGTTNTYISALFAGLFLFLALLFAYFQI